MFDLFSKRDGRILAKHRAESAVRATGLFTEEHLQQALAVFELDGLLGRRTVSDVAKLVHKSKDDVLRVLDLSPAVRHGEHYQGEIKSKTGGGYMKECYTKVTVTGPGMVTVVGLLLADTPAMAPYLNCLTALISCLLSVISSMQASWNELQEERRNRKSEVTAFNDGVCALTGLDRQAVISATAHTYKVSYKGLYFCDNSTKEAMQTTRTLQPHMLNADGKLKGKVHDYFSLHGQKAESFRLSMTTEAIRVCADEINAMGSPEERKAKVKEISYGVHQHLKDRGTFVVPGATELQQISAYLRYA
ncbi:hypothetical protein FOA52_003966 [Chlamydomonas sp. UWO 241]|nr:hypothetical protein FOA52_003966 [Chlamydomonas sp. UWO 241]